MVRFLSRNLLKKKFMRAVVVIFFLELIITAPHSL